MRKVILFIKNNNMKEIFQNPKLLAFKESILILCKNILAQIGKNKGVGNLTSRMRASEKLLKNRKN